MAEKKKTGLDLLREPFPPHQISKLPKPTKKRDEMDKLPKAVCKECGNYHATSCVIHLDYVGHAALTDRLLDADPNWTWEPMALDASGYPVLDKDGGMWIKLTVCGVTRLGYGDAQGKSGGDAMKERIGDALRNAAMRFGAALELWHKGDLHLDEDPQEDPQKEPVTTPPPTAAPSPHPTGNGNSRPLSADQEKYFPRVLSALKSLYGEDNEAKKSAIERETAMPANGSYPERLGVKDYRTLDGKRLQILCHKLEAAVKKSAGNDPIAEPDICPLCQEQRVNGVCHTMTCPNGEPF